MVKTLQDLRTESANYVEKARLFQEKQAADNKPTPQDWDTPAQEEFTNLMKAANEANAAYQKAFKLQESFEGLKGLVTDLDLPEPDRHRQQAPNLQGASSIISWHAPMNRRIERQWNRSTVNEGGRYGTGVPGQLSYETDWNRFLRGSRSAEAKLASTGMSSDNEERGGYFITSESFMSEIIKQVDDAVFVQGLSRVIMMPPARSLGVRVRRARASTFAWAGENTDTTPTLDTSLLYGKRYLTPNYLQGSTVISRDLLRNVPSAEGMVVEEIGIDLNYKLEPAFLTGDGNQKPLGLMTPSADGIDTSRDYTATGAASTFTFDDFSNIKYSLKGKYRSKANWMLHRNVLAATALLKDGMGQYLWQPSRQVGFPDIILGSPVTETEWMPNAVSSGLYFALFGDFSYYWIVYEMGMEMQRLVESKAHTNEVEYLFRCKLDAQPVLAEAFVRGKRP